MRGGTYTYAMLGQTVLSGKDGSSGNYINIWNYPGETPIIDFISYPNSTDGCIITIENADYVYLKGIECKNLKQPSSGAFLHKGLYIGEDVNYSIIENCNIHHIGGWGVIIYGGSNTAGTASSNNLILNCDSHHNSDRYSAGDPWGGADGFLINSYNGTAYPSMNNTFRYCRSYWNGDDGWDNRLFSGSLTYDGCWAFKNGYQPGETDSDPDVLSAGGNGYGFKLGSKYDTDVSTVLRTIYNCLSFENRETGFQYGHSTDPGEADFSCNTYHCVAYGQNLGFLYGPLDVGTNTLTNNLSYGNVDDFVQADVNDTYNASDSSYWYERNFTSTAADFASLNSSGTDGARNSNGSLPVLSFLHLASTSNLIGAGITISGIDYDAVGNLWSSPPSIGAYEYVTATTPTRTPTRTPSLSISATRTPSLSVSSAVVTPSPTPSLSISVTRTPSLSVSSAVVTPSPTPSLSISATRTPSLSISATPSLSISRTPSLSVSSAVVTPSPTPSLSISRTPSLSISRTPSLSISRTQTPSVTPSLSISKTPSLSISKTPSLSISATRTPSRTPSLSVPGNFYNVTRYSVVGGVCDTNLGSGTINNATALSVGYYYCYTPEVYYISSTAASSANNTTITSAARTTCDLAAGLDCS
jgi:hypothetical protein